MLTTLHKNVKELTGKTDRQMSQLKVKPHCIIEYNKNVGTVDRSDMTFSSTECGTEEVKWYKKLLFHFLDLPPLNSQTVCNVKTGRNISLADF
jgi:hypothetical protein